MTGPGSTPVVSYQARCAPEFGSLLARFDRRALDDHAGAVFGLWADFRLAYVNAAWYRFAAENAGEPAISQRWSLGSVFMEAVPADLQPYYRYLFALANTRGRRVTAPLCHEYECSSPDTYRRFAMQVYTLDDFRGFLVVNSLRLEHPHALDDAVAAPRAEDYQDDNGLVCQCSHCRRYRRRGLPERWDWVPAWVRRQPARTSHGLCRICFDYYYPKVPALTPDEDTPGGKATEA